MQAFFFFSFIVLIFFTNRVTYRKLNKLIPKVPLFLRIVFGSFLTGLFFAVLIFSILKISQIEPFDMTNQLFQAIVTAWLAASILVFFIDFAVYSGPNDEESWLGKLGSKESELLFFLKINNRSNLVLWIFFLSLIVFVLLLPSINQESNEESHLMQTLETGNCLEDKLIQSNYPLKQVCENPLIKNKLDAIYKLLHDTQSSLINDESKFFRTGQNRLDRLTLRLDRKHLSRDILKCLDEKCIGEAISYFDCEMDFIDSNPEKNYFEAKAICHPQEDVKK